MPLAFKPFALSLRVAVAICAVPFPLFAHSTQHSPAPAAAVEVVKSFYQFHFSNNMALTERNIRARRKWFTPELYRSLLYEMRREADFAKANPDMVPYYVGDPFTHSQEYPDTFRVAKSNVVGGNAVVDVLFSWGEHPEMRAVAVVLKRYKGKWLISNLIDEKGVDLLSELNRKEYSQ